MKKFSFSLEKVLNVRTTLLEREKTELALQRQQLINLENKRDYLKAELEHKSAENRQKMSEGISADDLRAYYYLEDSMKRQIKRAEADVVFQQNHVEIQLRKVVELDKDVKVLEKLKEKQLEEYNYEAQKEEREEILEMFSRKTTLNQRKNDDNQCNEGTES